MSPKGGRLSDWIEIRPFSANEADSHSTLCKVNGLLMYQNDNEDGKEA